MYINNFDLLIIGTNVGMNYYKHLIFIKQFDFDGGVNSICYLNDGKNIVCALDNKTVLVVSIKEPYSSKVISQLDFAVTQIVSSLDANEIYFRNEVGLIKYNYEEAKVVSQAEYKDICKIGLLICNSEVNNIVTDRSSIIEKRFDSISNEVNKINFAFSKFLVAITTKIRILVFHTTLNSPIEKNLLIDHKNESEYEVLDSVFLDDDNHILVGQFVIAVLGCDKSKYNTILLMKIHTADLKVTTFKEIKLNSFLTKMIYHYSDSVILLSQDSGFYIKNLNEGVNKEEKLKSSSLSKTYTDGFYLGDGTTIALSSLSGKIEIWGL